MPLIPEEAARHIGETATACRVVASAEYEPNVQRQPTLLDLGKPASREASPERDLLRRDLRHRSGEIRHPRGIAARQAHLHPEGQSPTTPASRKSF